jgi:hypothetical protein
MINKKGMPKRLGCFLAKRVKAGLDEKLAMTRKIESETPITFTADAGLIAKKCA